MVFLIFEDEVEGCVCCQPLHPEILLEEKQTDEWLNHTSFQEAADQAQHVLRCWNDVKHFRANLRDRVGTDSDVEHFLDESLSAYHSNGHSRLVATDTFELSSMTGEYHNLALAVYWVRRDHVAMVSQQQH